MSFSTLFSTMMPKNEIFGLAPFEGLLCGAPAVVSDDCGCGQIISEAQAGLLVKFGDVESLRQKMRILLNDPVASRSMVRRGRMYIKDNLSFSAVAEKHLKMYEEILRDGAYG